MKWLKLFLVVSSPRPWATGRWSTGSTWAPTRASSRPASSRPTPTSTRSPASASRASVSVPLIYSYRVTNLVGKNVPLTLFWQLVDYYMYCIYLLPRFLSELEVFTNHLGHPLDSHYTLNLFISQTGSQEISINLKIVMSNLSLGENWKSNPSCVAFKNKVWAGGRTPTYCNHGALRTPA